MHQNAAVAERKERRDMHISNPKCQESKLLCQTKTSSAFDYGFDWFVMSCPDCTTGGLLPGEPSGVFSTQGAYFSAAPSPPEHSSGKRAVILLTDGFGLPLKNCKILADGFAKE